MGLLSLMDAEKSRADFGKTRTPVCGPFVELMKIVDNLGFTDTAKQKYLQGNARRILNLPT